MLLVIVNASPPAPPLPSPPDVTRLGLRGGLIWTLLGQGGAAAAQWLIVVVLARQEGAQAVGLYALGLALTAPLFLLLGLQLRGVQATDAQGRYPFGAYARLRLPAMALGLLATAGLAALHPQAGAVIWWLGVAKALEGVSDLLYGQMQARERLDWVAQSTLLRGALGLALLGAVTLLGGPLALAALGVAAGSGVALALDLRRSAALGIPWTRQAWWAPLSVSLVRLAWPLGAVMALVSLGSNLPRLFVERLLGPELLGIYSALAYVGVAGSVVVVALGTALTTRLAQHYERGDRRAFLALTARLYGLALALGLALVTLGLVAGKPLLNVLYGPAYAAYSSVFNWLNVAAACAYLASCAGFTLTAARQFREQLPLFLVVTLGLTLACWSLIRPHGLTGAAYAGMVGAGLQLLGSAWLLAARLRQMGGARAVGNA
jgi:O-antigen/teichoic acid export membrane protein